MTEISRLSVWDHLLVLFGGAWGAVMCFNVGVLMNLNICGALIFFGVWTLGGVMSYGIVFASFERKFAYSTIAKKGSLREHEHLAYVGLPLGVLGLILSLCLFGTKYGVMYERRSYDQAVTDFWDGEPDDDKWFAERTLERFPKFADDMTDEEYYAATRFLRS